MSGLVGHRGLLLSDSAGVDPAWANVTSLLHFDGTNGSTAFTDETGVAWSIVLSGAQLSDVEKKFGPTSYEVGAGSCIGTTAAVSGHAFGSGDFTIEGFFRPFDSPASGGTYRIFCSRDYTGESSNRGWLLLQDGDNGGRLLFAIFSGTTGYIVQKPVLLTSLAWVHVAVVRSDDALLLFVDGILEDTETISGTMNDSGEPTRISGFRTPFGVGAPLTGGYVDEFRITKGVARYTSNFTPPAAPFPDS